MLKKIDLSLKPKKSLLKKSKNTNNNNKNRKNIEWDTQAIEEHKEYFSQHPPTMHIDEPKTPYTPYEEGDNDYLEKIRRMFKVEATEDVLKDVSKELDKLKDKKNNDDEFMNVIIIDKDGNKNTKIVSKDHKENIEFLKKRKIAYENEYIKANEIIKEDDKKEINNNIQTIKDNNIDKEEMNEERRKEIELDDMTLKNTIINKFSGIIRKKEKEKLIKEEIEKIKNKNEK